MGVKWTAQQQMVIDRRDDNILVSASAGSGKTAVLVQRILAYLTDRERPCDIDRLLVVTFTRAAAAEMKERVGKAIREALDADPENAHLQRQNTLIHNAQITTIDGFCSWLVRNYCYRTDLEPGFRVGEEGELKLLSADVMEEVLDAGYGAGEPIFRERFRQMAESFATGKSDKALEDAILKVAGAAESQPWPELWMAECRRNNRADSLPLMESLPWMAHFSGGAEREIRQGLALARENLELAKSPEGPSAYLATAESWAGFFEELAATIPPKEERRAPDEGSAALPGSPADSKGASSSGDGCTVSSGDGNAALPGSPSDSRGAASSGAPAGAGAAGSFAESVYVRRQRLLAGFSPAALGRKKALAGEIPELREVFKARRDELEGVRKQLSSMYAFAEEDAVANMQKNEGVLNTLLDAAALYLERFAEKKRERHLVDFADLEHFALEILRGRPGTWADPLSPGRTEVARELAGRFREVLVDEYQDSNDLQEAILTAVSRIEDGGRNYFCVGDVKQSIYGFRNAHPDLFMEKFVLYRPAGGSDPAAEGRSAPAAEEGSGRAAAEGRSAPASEEGSGRAAAEGRSGPASEDRSGPASDNTSISAARLRGGRFISPARRGLRIDLLQNFRSRREVLSAANGIFRQVMIPEAGGVSYGDEAALVFGASGYLEDASGCFTAELLAIDSGEKDDEGESLLDDTGAAAKRELEARAIGERIRKMVRYEKIWDDKAKQMRPVEYRDIVILLRTMQGWADPFASVLEAMGIRAFSTARSGYFSASEVSLMLDYLAIVDNPLQDIPVAAVLHSPIVGLTAGELAGVRLVFGSPAEDPAAGRKSLWECARAAAETESPAGEGNPSPEETFPASGRASPEEASPESGPASPEADSPALSFETMLKLQSFFAFYDEVRAEAPDTPLHELIWKIYNGTGYFDYASALPGGVQRAANLRMLAEKARDYEATSYVGLSAFIRYINNLKRYEVDLAAAGTVGENENAVRIISIHKSKGLEYPIVFVSGLGKNFNRMELSEKLLVDAEDGLAADCTDPEQRTVVPTIKKEAVRQHLLRDSVGEELRVLYVALTRAKQKLILTGTVASGEAFEDLANLPLPLREETFGAGYVLGAKNAMALMVPAVRRLRQRAELAAKRAANAGAPGPLPSPEEVFREVLVEPSELVSGEVEHQARGEEIIERLRSLRPEEVFDPFMREVLEERCSWHYPYEGRANIPVKVSVSELKKGFAPDEDSSSLYAEPELVPYVPLFIREREAAGKRPPAVLSGEEKSGSEESRSEEGGLTEGMAAAAPGGEPPHTWGKASPDFAKERSDSPGKEPSEASDGGSGNSAPGDEAPAGPGGAARGTAYHRVMELLRYEEFSELTAGDSGEKLSETGEKPGDSGEKPGETGEKPGDSGEKPGDSGEKLSETGEKPGDSGEKLSETGEKPGDSGEKSGETGSSASIEERIRLQMEAFVREGLMEEGDAEAVDAKDIARFLRSRIGRRFAAAAAKGRLRREQPFAMEVPADRIRPEYPEDETILIQGIIDAYFFETNASGEEEIVLVDYKTDRVRLLSQLSLRYRVQLDAYAEALEKAAGRRVSEKIIWSFFHGRELVL